ncbi:MAG: hypothetical protein PQJ59_10880 [Spirochaetales bacterium]|nr:hypothetical protein [Spirochaetales bacterium]
MKYLIFTERETIKASFRHSGYLPLGFHGLSEIREVCKGIRGAIIYVDRDSLSNEELEQHLSYFNNRADLRIAIIDGKDITNDPAEYFQNGAVDYIGPALLKEGLSRQRLEKVQRFNPIERRFINEGFDSSVPYSGRNWDSVKEGEEYVFSMLYAGLDDMGRIREHLGQEGAERFNLEFRNWMDHHMDAWYGYRWLWNGWGGVYLFPFDGQNFYAMEAAMECYLNRKINKFSNYEIKTTFRLALHLGSTIFLKRGETGSIVSDSINSLFHIACRDGSEDELVLSEEVRAQIPPTLHPYLEKGVEFEGRKIYRLKSCL